MNYANYVDTENIEIDGEKDGTQSFRYSLCIPIRSDGINNILVVMMNPSMANKYESDATVNRVIEYVKRQNNYYSNYIHNLFYKIHIIRSIIG